MEIIYQLESPQINSAQIITIGNFDGVHLGHQALLQRMRELAYPLNAELTAITFENHPLEVLRPEQPLQRLTSLAHKIELLGELGLNRLILLKFTQELSRESPEQFLKRIQELFPHSQLLLGHDATLGKDKIGDRQHLLALSKKLSLPITYIEPYAFEGEVISSSAIRRNIQSGKLLTAAKLLGRDYSILSIVIPGLSKGAQIGFPTLNIDVENFCTPPLGVYAVKVRHQSDWWQGVANLGMAPTIRNDNKPLLEVHLFDFQQAIYGQLVEVVFERYLRTEKKFSSIKELQDQIKQDIEEAKGI